MPPGGQRPTRTTLCLEWANGGDFLAITHSYTRPDLSGSSCWMLKGVHNYVTAWVVREALRLLLHPSIKPTA
jgi:hypothetical protein